MKLLLSIILFFTIGLINNPTQQPSLFKISTFKDIPDDMTGCGDAYYLSEKDKKEEKKVCVTHFRTALICINDKLMRLTDNHQLTHRGEHIYTSGNYTLTTKLDHEYYVMKGTMIIKYRNKIIWSKKVIGDGGC